MESDFLPDRVFVDDLTNEFLAESFDGLDRMDGCLTELEEKPQDAHLLAEIFRTVHTIKGTTGFLGFSRLEKLAHAGEHLLGLLREGRVPVHEGLISGLLQLMDGLRAILNLIEKTGKEGTRAADHDDELLRLLNDLAEGRDERENTHPAVPALTPCPVAVPPRESVQLAEVKADGERRSPQSADIGVGGISEKTLRVEVEVLNRMMNLVGELVLTRNQMLQTHLQAANFVELTRRLDSVTADLRETVMQARMQPVGHVFRKFPRMVRDLAKTCGKLVRIEFAGQEAGLDKSLLEAIKDPLTHAVRNAVDHGIESPSERLSLGKSEEGLVCLRAFHQNGYVVIEVVDDGRGISASRVRAKAISQGLVTEEQAAAMTPHEIQQIIFLPGFSTAAEVTHLSGRGVGMDVVRANVEQVRGTVEVLSEEGRGTLLRLRVPLTLAIVPALVVESGGQNFCLPQGALAELVYVTGAEAPGAIEPIGDAEFYRLRETLLPLVWLDGLMHLPRADRGAGFYIVVLDAEGCRYGLVVDGLMSPEEIVVKPLSAVLREIGLFSGATVLGNGTLAMILDVAAMALRVGLRPVLEEKPGRAQVETKSGKAGSSAFLICENRAQSGHDERIAVPLESVERIESIALEAVEFAGGRLLMQYCGGLLPLEDAGDLLGELAGRRASDPVTVLVCRQPDGRQSGLIVKRALGVADGAMVNRGAGEVPLAVVEERLAVVRSEFATQDLQEVA